jgi:hypothetical protein
MRTSTHLHLASQVRCGAILATLSFIIASGLTGCSAASPTEPVLEASVDPGRIGDQTAIPTEWLPRAPAVAPVLIQPSAKPVQRKPDGIHYTTHTARGF